MEIADIQSAVRKGSVRITDHADEEARNDNLSYDEILFSVLMGKIIEDYPDDKPYPSCLILMSSYLLGERAKNGTPKIWQRTQSIAAISLRTLRALW